MDCTGSFPWWWSSFAGCISILYNIKDKTVPLPCSWGCPGQRILGSATAGPRFKWCAAIHCWKMFSSPKQSITMLQPMTAAACSLQKWARDAHALSQQTASLPPCPLSPVRLLTPLSCKSWHQPHPCSLPLHAHDAIRRMPWISHPCSATFRTDEKMCFSLKGEFLALQGLEIMASLYQGIGELLHKPVWQNTGAHSRESSKIISSEYIEGQFIPTQVIWGHFKICSSSLPAQEQQVTLGNQTP